MIKFFRKRKIVVKKIACCFQQVLRQPILCTLITTIHAIKPYGSYKTVAYTITLALSSHVYAIDTNIKPTRGDGDLKTEVTSDNGSTYDIMGGTRYNNGTNYGTNLFHSFDEFSISQDNTANFKNETGLETYNIFSRVIGGNESTIMGTIKTTKFPNADVYLLNPAGIVFGHGATIDVQGAFYASTANSVDFTKDARFIADSSSKIPELTVASPASFGFLKKAVGEIKVSGSLIIENMTKEFTLIGGPIDFSGAFVFAPGRPINIVSAGSGATARIENGTVDLAEGEPRNSVKLSRSSINQSKSGTQGNSENKPGDIRILGDTVEIISSKLNTKSENNEKSGDIFISASDSIDIKMSKSTKIKTRSTLSAKNSDGKSGDINLLAKHRISLSSRPGLQTILSTASSSGESGNIKINVTDGDITITNTQLQSVVNEKEGKTATIKLSANKGVITLGKGAEIVSRSNERDAGEVTISAHVFEMIDGAKIRGNTIGTAKGATVNIKSPNVTITDGSTISTASTGRNLNVEQNPELGKAGNIFLDAGETGEVKISDGAIITAETIGDGKGGNIKIVAGRFVIENNSEVSATTSETAQGEGGTIDIQATDIQLRNAGSISAKSAGLGDSGNITITQADTVTLFDNSEITVRTEKADANAGDITINAKTLVHLRNKSSIETSAAVKDNKGTGSGGNINIDPKLVILDGASSIRANAQKGDGGNIMIKITDGGALFMSPDSTIDASSAEGIDGTVEITHTDSDIIRGTLVLPESFLDTAKLLNEKCRAHRASGGGASSFVVSGRSGVPPGPDALLPDYVSVLDEETSEDERKYETAYRLPVPNLEINQNQLGQYIIGCKSG